MAKTPQTKGGYVRVDGLDDDDSDEGAASIQAHWRRRAMCPQNSCAFPLQNLCLTQKCLFAWHRHFSCASAMAYAWVTPIFKLGMQRQINLEDLPPLDTGPIYWQQLDLEPLLAKTKDVLH
eukprot:COSAG02_NODE_5592_length_4206_cov_2.462381_6_plen_120_part_01